MLKRSLGIIVVFRLLLLAVIAGVLFSSLLVTTKAQRSDVLTGDKSRSVDSKPALIEAPSSILTVLFTEDFNYTAASALAGQGGWAAHSGAGTNAQTVTAPSLSYTSYPNSGVGNSVTITTSGEDDNNTFAAQTTGSVYAAAMVNVASAQATGDYAFHLVDGIITGNLFKGRLFIKKDAVAATYGFGIQKSSTANAVYTPTTIATGTTHLVVIKYTFVAGTANDTVDLIVDPVIAGCVEPQPTLTAPLGTDTDAVDIRGVAIRQGNAANAAALTIDGIRVANTWGDAVGCTLAADVSLSGRVTTADGRGITNARVTVSGNSLPQPRVIITGRRGGFTFDNLDAGETYVVTVGSRRFFFSNPSRIITLNDNAENFDFVADSN